MLQKKQLDRHGNALEHLDGGQGGECMPGSKQRFLFIDHLRFFAVLFMIQGHVADAVLSVTVKANPRFYYYDFIHGFVAPVFLVASGLAFGVSTLRHWDEYTVMGTASSPSRGAAFSVCLPSVMRCTFHTFP